MHRVLACSLVLLLSVPLSSVPAAAAGQGAAAGSISGAARNASGQVVGRSTIQLRNVTTGQLTGTTTGNAAGAFTFAGLQPGTYVVEVLDAAGEIIGTSSAISLAAGAVVTGIGVTASALVASTGGAFFASTVGLVTLAAAGAGVAAVTVAKTRTTASASQ